MDEAKSDWDTASVMSRAASTPCSIVGSALRRRPRSWQSRVNTATVNVPHETPRTRMALPPCRSHRAVEQAIVARVANVGRDAHAGTARVSQACRRAGSQAGQVEATIHESSKSSPTSGERKHHMHDETTKRRRERTVISSASSQIWRRRPPGQPTPGAILPGERWVLPGRVSALRLKRNPPSGFRHSGHESRHL